jgi:glycine/sarcosine/betaine reductase complex component A
MDLENQKRVKALAEEHGAENILVLLGGADPEASGLIAETVIAGDPAYAGLLTGVQLGLPTYHIVEPEIKNEIDSAVYEENIAMMEMVLEVDEIISEVSAIREQFLK